MSVALLPSLFSMRPNCRWTSFLPSPIWSDSGVTPFQARSPVSVLPPQSIRWRSAIPHPPRRQFSLDLGQSAVDETADSRVSDIVGAAVFQVPSAGEVPHDRGGLAAVNGEPVNELGVFRRMRESPVATDVL